MLKENSHIHKWHTTWVCCNTKWCPQIITQKPRVINLLTDASISCQNISILKDGQLGWSGLADLQHTAPLGKVCTVLLVLCAALRQPVQTCTHTQTLQSEATRQGVLLNFVRFESACVPNASYPEWWSLHLFQQGAQHLCPPEKDRK